MFNQSIGTKGNYLSVSYCFKLHDGNNPPQHHFICETCGQPLSHKSCVMYQDRPTCNVCESKVWGGGGDGGGPFLPKS